MRNIKQIDFLKLGQATLGFTLALAPFTSFAALPQPGCGTLNGIRCDGTGGPNDLIVSVLNIILGVAALVAVLFLVIGGFRYIISAGNDDQAKGARKTIINALIGIVVIILSYVIVSVVNRTVSSGAGSPV